MEARRGDCRFQQSPGLHCTHVGPLPWHQEITEPLPRHFFSAPADLLGRGAPQPSETSRRPTFPSFDSSPALRADPLLQPRELYAGYNLSHLHSPALLLQDLYNHCIRHPTMLRSGLGRFISIIVALPGMHRKTLGLKLSLR
jgi:hypothetical protein